MGSVLQFAPHTKFFTRQLGPELNPLGGSWNKKLENPMIDIKQLTQDKAHLVELWKFLGLPEAMPDISLWQMDYGMDMIESGFKTLKKLINKGLTFATCRSSSGRFFTTPNWPS